MANYDWEKIKQLGQKNKKEETNNIEPDSKLEKKNERKIRRFIMGLGMTRHVGTVKAGFSLNLDRYDTGGKI